MSPPTQKQQFKTLKSPSQQTRLRVRASKTPNKQNELSCDPVSSFAIGELIWGPARGYPAWPGKIVRMPEGACSTTQQHQMVWVQWFGSGGRVNSELVALSSLQSLSDGLEAHHKAQKDTRKSRKLNSQLERAIQEAMTELDRISASSTSPTTITGSTTQHAAPAKQQQIQQPTSTWHVGSPNRNKRTYNGRTATSHAGYTLISNAGGANVISTTTNATHYNNSGVQQRTKPIRIAPAPPSTTATTLKNTPSIVSYSQGSTRMQLNK